MDFEILAAGNQDIEGIMNIRNYYILNSTALWYPNPFSPAEIEKWYENTIKKHYPLLVAKKGEHVIGYASLSSFRSNPAYRFTAENSLYVLPEARGKGVGSALMYALIEAARREQLRVITAWIDAENVESIDFHTRHGFTMVGTMDDVGEKWGELRSVSIMQRIL